MYTAKSTKFITKKMRFGTPSIGHSKVS